MGGARTCHLVCASRAVTSTDGWPLTNFPFQREFLGRGMTAAREVRGINRVVCGVTSKPCGTIERNPLSRQAARAFTRGTIKEHRRHTIGAAFLGGSRRSSERNPAAKRLRNVNVLRLKDCPYYAT